MAPNASSKPLLDEYGRPIDTLDFNVISSGSKKMPFTSVSSVSDDPKDFGVTVYYSFIIFHFVQFAAMYLGGGYTWLPLIVFYVMVPIADTFLGSTKVNPSKDLEKKMDAELKYRIVPIIWVIAQTVTYLCSMWWSVQPERTTNEFIAGAICTGQILGLGINTAHELGHKRTWWEPLLAQYLLAMTSYMHFQVEHVEGHHWNVATPMDPATSRYNETFYSFWPRTVYGSYISAWHIENRRCAKKGLPFYLNMMYWYTLTPIVLAALAGKVYGFSGVSFFVLSSFMGFSLLEVVNYIEHYGLVRKEIAPGRYERVRPIHSWNADNKVTNYLLFKLQRHSDHHAFPIRRYQILRSFDESPNLPSGYATCMILALIPPLWFHVMNPKVEEFNRWVQESRNEMEAKGIKVE
eukprot:Clim_evm5s81 gene=Clim_evmTU5s81